MTKPRPGSDRDTADESPPHASVARRPKRQRGEPKLYITFLPEGKGGPREEKGSVPLEVEFEDHIEERSDCAPGLYRIEKKRSGEFSGEVLFYTKEDDTSSVAESDDTDVDINVVDFASKSDGPLSAPDIARLVATTVNATLEAREKRDRAAQQQPGAIDMLREIEEIAERRAERETQRREEIRAEISAMLGPGSNNESALDDKTRLELAAVRETRIIPEIFRNMREMMGTADRIQEPESLIDKVFGFAKEFVPYVGPIVGPAVGAKLLGMLSRVDDAALMNAAQQSLAQRSIETSTAPATAVVSDASESGDAQPIAAVAEGPAPLTFDVVVRNIVTDLQQDNPPDDAVTEIVTLTTSHPELLPVISSMMNESNESLLEKLGLACGVQLGQVIGANKYLNGLRAGLKKRIRLIEPQPVVPDVVSPNGKTQTVAASAKG